jgi:hypothetical protein
MRYKRRLAEEDRDRDRDEAVDGGREQKLGGALNLFLD